MTKKISVIIPVYNGEKYLARCVDSVLAQENFNVSDLEILLINDGSKDCSLDILNQYKNRYPGIINIIDQKNMGVAKTRNRGIDSATGKYVMFIDQDDFVDKSYCKTFYDVAELSSSDVVVGGYRRPDSAEKSLRVVTQSNDEYSKKYKISAAWAKIHKTDFLRYQKIEFYNNNYGEDILFTMNENSKTDRILSINYVGYNWYWNLESVSNTDQRGLRGDIKILNLLDAMTPYIKNELDEYYVVQTGVHYLLFSGRNASKIDFINLYTKIFALYDKNKIRYRKNKLILLGPAGALPITRYAISIFVFLHKVKAIGLFATLYCRGRNYTA